MELITHKRQTMTEMAKAQGLPDWFVKKVVVGAKKTESVGKYRRIQHRWAKRGWVTNKHGAFIEKSAAIMSVAEYLFLKDRYFPENADNHERTKLLEEYKRDYPRGRSCE